MTATRVAVLALALGLLAGGCGGGNEDADRFQDGYNAAVARLNDVTASGQDLARKSGAEISREFARTADAAEQTRERLEELDPPEDAGDELDRLLAAVDRGVKDIRAAAKAAKRESRERFADALEAVSESSAEIDQAEAALREAVDG
jgi:hypothetical protein